MNHPDRYRQFAKSRDSPLGCDLHAKKKARQNSYTGTGGHRMPLD